MAAPFFIRPSARMKGLIKADAADREILHGARGLRSIVGVSRHLHFAE